MTEQTNNYPEWWRPVWVCLAGAQAIPNVAPLLPYPPQKVYYLHTDYNNSVEAANRCKKFIEHKNVSVVLKRIPSHDMQSIINITNEIIDREELGNVLINWTGGTKPMSFAVLLAGTKCSNIYYDSRTGLIVNFSLPDLEFREHIPNLTVEEIFQLNADITEVRQAHSISINAPHTARFLSDVLSDELDIKHFKFPKLPYLMHLIFQKNPVRFGKKGGFAPLDKPLSTNPFQKYSTQIADSFVESLSKDNLLDRRAKGSFWPSPKGLRYMAGLWFEDFVAGKLREALNASDHTFKEVDFRTNLEFRWGTSGNAKNEIDILFKRRDMLYLVSCTTASESDTNKRRDQIEVFSQKLGGAFAKPMLACTLPDKALSNVQNRTGIFMPHLLDWSDPVRVLEMWENP